MRRFLAVASIATLAWVASVARIVPVAGFVAILSLSSAPCFGAAGETGGNFLLLPTSARESALAETDVANAEGAFALHGNPAAVAREHDLQIGFSHITWVADIDLMSAAVSGLDGGGGVIALGVRRMGAGDLPERDVTGAAIGTLSPADLAVDGAYAWSVRRGLRVGGGVTFLHSKIQETATAITTAFGAEVDLWEGNLTLGAALRNFGGSLKFIAESDPLPRTFALGAAYRSHAGQLAVEADFPRDDDAYVGVGLEVPVVANEDIALSLRGGYSTLASEEVGGTSEFRAGAGLRYRMATISYAWLPLGDVGDTHHITLELRP